MRCVCRARDGDHGPYPWFVAVDHHDHDRIVEVTRVPSRFEADALIAKLRANGITASARYGDAGGWAPQFAQFSGPGVLGFESAAALIADE
jgi:hypothetical protein